MRSYTVTGLGGTLGNVELGGVRDVADDAGLGARAEEGPLRSLQHLDAVEVGRIDVEVVIRKLHGLVVEIDRDVRIKTGRAAVLTGTDASVQSAHEDFALPGSAVGRTDAGQVLDVVIERVDVQRFERLGGEIGRAHV